MKAIEITEAEYAEYTVMEFDGPFKPLGRYRSEDGTVLGVLCKCSYDKDFNWVALGPDENGTWRAFDMGTSYPDMRQAFKDMEECMSRERGQSVYPQGDV